jgi:tripartite-type tricarboxylate transporter receptor subunit TctC
MVVSPSMSAKTVPEFIDYAKANPGKVTLNKAINAALTDQRMKARLADLGFEPFASSPAEFGNYIIQYSAKWGKVVRAANIKSE